MLALNTARKKALVIVGAGVLLALFAAVVCYFMFVYTAPGVPTTAQEASLITQRGRYQGSRDIDTWYGYVTQLIQARQYTEAQAEIASTTDSDLKDQDSYDNYILAAQAELDFAQRKYAKAYKSALLAQKAMKAAYKKELASDDMPNRAKSLGISDNYSTLFLLEAGALREFHRFAQEKAALQAYLKVHPTEGGVWVDLGDCCRTLGEKSSARRAYEQALKYVPEYGPAQAGLRKLEQ